MADDDPNPNPGDDPATDPPADDLGDAGKKALAAERKARREAEKQLRDIQARLKEIEDAEKPEIDKLREEVEDLRRTAAQHEAAALRAEVAMSKGLTAGQAKRLQGATREELEADADEILEQFPAAGGAKPPPSSKPSPDLKGGTDPTSVPEEMNPAKLANGLPRF